MLSVRFHLSARGRKAYEGVSPFHSDTIVLLFVMSSDLKRLFMSYLGFCLQDGYLVCI